MALTGENSNKSRSDGPSTTKIEHEPSPLASRQRPSKSLFRWQILDTSEWEILIFSTVIKVLLFPAYRSTDFEVHRNWLAITHSLPISKWYYDTTSEWTLDYPPFFAYFEYLLSIPAAFVDWRIVDLNNLNYNAWTVVAYQRSTVILTELVLGAALLRLYRGNGDTSQKIIAISLFLHPGFIIIDHIHFQYNGFMFGILLWSILMAKEGNNLLSGALFAVLLNFKHIYMYQAPAYFIYLLRAFCLSPKGELLLTRFLSLANIVILIFVLSLGPFLLMGQLPQLLSRLFPFTRGLNHAYWAPNAWALITALDRVLLSYARSAGLNIVLNPTGVASTSRGLVGDTIFAVLPNVKPLHTFMLTIGLQCVFLTKLWTTPNYKSFVTCLTLCGFTSYMFGWHVHEKAILIVLVPLSLLASENYYLFRSFEIASVSGIFSLFPLLFTPAESFAEILYSALWSMMVLEPLRRRLYKPQRLLPLIILDRIESFYLMGFLALQLLITALHYLSRQVNQCQLSGSYDGVTSSLIMRIASMEFLPLLLTSIYCAIGMTWAYIRLSIQYLAIL